MKANNLIMDLTQEQGEGRETQVQPTSEIWEQFFGVRVFAKGSPTFRMVNMERPEEVEQRRVVRHHHNLTIEIPAVGTQRPTILRVRRNGTNSFQYWVYRPKSKEYRHCDWIFSELAGPTEDRRWIIF